MDKLYDKRITRAQRTSKSGNTHRFTQNDTKKLAKWKPPGHDRSFVFWFKKFTSIHEILALEMDRYLQGAHVSE